MSRNEALSRDESLHECAWRCFRPPAPIGSSYDSLLSHLPQPFHRALCRVGSPRFAGTRLEAASQGIRRPRLRPKQPLMDIMSGEKWAASLVSISTDILEGRASVM